MENKIYLNAHFGYREDTLANWERFNPLLERGEISFVRDGTDGKFVKIGDGTTLWNALPYAPLPKGEKGDKGDTGADGKDAVTDQSYNPESENAQSGKAVAEALKSKVLVDVTLTEEQVASGISGISVAIEDIEAYHNAKQVNIYVEMPFKDKALPSSTIAINVSDGAAYADYYGWQHGVTCPQGNTLYWHIFNVRESFHKSNNKKNMCSYYRAPVYYEGPNSLGTCSCLYGEVTHLANLKNHPPKLNLYWSGGGATLEAGTRIFVEVYE